MLSSIEQIELKELRGRILAILDYNYPAGLGTKLVAQSLAAAKFTISRREFIAQLAYLSEKGYIIVRSVGFEDLNLERELVTLTAKGKDLVDGNIDPDPGVSV